MRMLVGGLLAVGLGGASAADAATIVILTDPMTMERRTVVVEDRGPDRVLLCAMPPATSGCRDVTRRRRA